MLQYGQILFYIHYFCEISYIYCYFRGVTFSSCSSNMKLTAIKQAFITVRLYRGRRPTQSISFSRILFYPEKMLIWLTMSSFHRNTLTTFLSSLVWILHCHFVCPQLVVQTHDMPSPFTFLLFFYKKLLLLFSFCTNVIFQSDIEYCP